MLSFFPWDVLDEIFDLIESVSGGGGGGGFYLLLDDTGGKIEQTQQLSREVRGKKVQHICLYFFQIIRICVLK